MRHFHFALKTGYQPAVRFLSISGFEAPVLSVKGSAAGHYMLLIAVIPFQSIKI
jgi:hypothetical protein